MAREWTFGRRLGLGYAVTALLMLVTGIVSVVTLLTVVADKDDVIEVNGKGLVATQELRVAVEAKSSAARGYLLS
jgi:CHASE3 domain sensor protein